MSTGTINRSLAVVLTAGTLLLGAVGPSQAASHKPALTPAALDPGPAGDFNWKDLNWEKRWWSGAPQHNKSFSAGNVSNPDRNGHVTLTLTNPTGTSSVGAEFNTTRHGFGYGTYSTTVEKSLKTLQKEVVWGCLFTYDPNTAPGHTEIDLCEASSWGGGSSSGQTWPVTQGHGYWFDATKPPGVGNDTVVFPATNNPILTHRMVWEPGKITFETYSGDGYKGPLLKRTVLTGANVPVPANETIHFNLWTTAGGGGEPDRVKPEKVIVRDFSFTPRGSAASTPLLESVPAPAIKATASTVKTRGINTSTVKWAGATGAAVDLVIDGARRPVINAGTHAHRSAGKAPATFQVCDSTRCSTPGKVAP